MLSISRLLIVVAISISAGCALGVGRVGVTGGHARFGVNYTCVDADCSTSGLHNYSVSSYSYEPSDIHVGTVFGIYEGYAAATTSTSATNKQNTTSGVFEMSLGVHVVWGRFAVGTLFGYLSQSGLGADNLSCSGFPLGIYGMMALGESMTLIAGLDTLLLETMQDERFFDEDVSGHRLYLGVKAFAGTLGPFDLYPRLEVFNTQASGANGIDYDSFGVSGAVEMGL